MNAMKKNIFYYMYICFISISIFSYSYKVLANHEFTHLMQESAAWTNQSGSTLYIDQVSNIGEITGHYINRAAGYGCQRSHNSNRWKGI